MASQVVLDRINQVIAAEIMERRWKAEVTDDGYLLAVPHVGSSHLFAVQLDPGMERTERKVGGKFVFTVWLAGPEAATGKGEEVRLIDPSGSPTVLLAGFPTPRTEDETVDDLRECVTVKHVPLRRYVEARLRGRADVYPEPWGPGYSSALLTNPDGNRLNAARKRSGLEPCNPGG